MSGFAGKEIQYLLERVVKFIYQPFFERDDSIVCNCDIFRADVRAALGDIAVADTLMFS